MTLYARTLFTLGLHLQEHFVTGWTHSSSIFIVQMANQMKTEINGVDARRDLFEAYFLADESATDMAQAPLPFDAASRSGTPD